jgi:ribonuclease HI
MQSSIFSDIDDKNIIAFTDGSCNPNNRSPESRAGYATLFVSGFCANKCIFGNMDTKVAPSNIRAEGLAIFNAMKYVEHKEFTRLTIITDCQLWIKMFLLWMPKWTNAKFQQKENSDMTVPMWDLFKKLNDGKSSVGFLHVNSHNKSGWKSFPDDSYEKICYEHNDYVDKLCSYARINLKPGDELIQEKNAIKM